LGFVGQCLELPLRSSGFRLCHYRRKGSIFGLSEACSSS
jgi:hypothetical protein